MSKQKKNRFYFMICKDRKDRNQDFKKKVKIEKKGAI